MTTAPITGWSPYQPANSSPHINARAFRDKELAASVVLRCSECASTILRRPPYQNPNDETSYLCAKCNKKAVIQNKEPVAPVVCKCSACAAKIVRRRPYKNQKNEYLCAKCYKIEEFQTLIQDMKEKSAEKKQKIQSEEEAAPPCNDVVQKSQPTEESAPLPVPEDASPQLSSIDFGNDVVQKSQPAEESAPLPMPEDFFPQLSSIDFGSDLVLFFS